ncbi:phosphatidylserine decarboxylase [Sporosarcina sp. 6E9]|uniref:phosphatidylserine decarboxylase n=1 Tax=Sporosarcina sp. 6E9 TaxID=2819235 RepID=UPI001B30C727|nr:phosphatidylserine decarboxylase [Sporosarcina sp. 6E9]
MKKKIFRLFVELTGNPTSSKILKFITQSRMSRLLIRPFANTYQINQDEMEYPLAHYKSLQDLFTRNLKVGARSIDTSSNSLISPVDGCLSAVGKVDEQDTFIIKNQSYSLAKIFGDDKKASTYKNGSFFILYLSPSHYHHFHYPISGTIFSRYALGSISYPVNNLGLRLGNRPFSTNHRLISEIQTEFGKVAIVKVGALNVNSIHLNSSSKECIKGAEFGHFSFGSTVILFIEDHYTFTPTVPMNSEVKVGQPIAEWIK